MILINWRYAILTHMSVTVVAPTCQWDTNGIFPNCENYNGIFPSNPIFIEITRKPVCHLGALSALSPRAQRWQGYQFPSALSLLRCGNIKPCCQYSSKRNWMDNELAHKHCEMTFFFFRGRKDVIWPCPKLMGKHQSRSSKVWEILHRHSLNSIFIVSKIWSPANWWTEWAL
jgi:hypothetical protein